MVPPWMPSWRSISFFSALSSKVSVPFLPVMVMVWRRTGDTQLMVDTIGASPKWKVVTAACASGEPPSATADTRSGKRPNTASPIDRSCGSQSESSEASARGRSFMPSHVTALVAPSAGSSSSSARNAGLCRWICPTNTAPPPRAAAAQMR